MDIEKLIRPELAAMLGYTPIEPTEILEQKAGQRIVKLDGNENPYGCSPKVYQALANYPYYHIYPDPEQRALRQALEGYTGFSPQHIVCGSGSDELIDLVLRLFLQPGDEVINCSPTFGMYPFSTEVCGGKVIDIPRNENFDIDIVGIEKALNRKTKVIFIASPNNPTGNIITEQEVMKLIETGKIVVIDEAYFEFAQVSAISLVEQFPNLIVTRTFSKAFGLAGLRVGYLAAHPTVVEGLSRLYNPKSVNTMAQLGAHAALADRDYLNTYLDEVTASKELLRQFFATRRHVEAWITPANFVVVRTGNIDQTLRRLENLGVYVRDRSTYPGLEGCLRMTVGTTDQTQRLFERLSKVF